MERPFPADPYDQIFAEDGRDGKKVQNNPLTGTFCCSTLLNDLPHSPIFMLKTFKDDQGAFILMLPFSGTTYY